MSSKYTPEQRKFLDEVNELGRQNYTYYHPHYEKNQIKSARIEITRHINGSGPNAFGGHKYWPHFAVGISLGPDELPEDANALFDDLEAVLEKHGYKFDNFKSTPFGD